MAWWPRKKKLMAAIISCSYGLGPFIFTIIESYWINPNNISPNNKYGYMREYNLMYNFPDIFAFLALIFSLIQVIGILCLRNPNTSYYLYSINEYYSNHKRTGNNPFNHSSPYNPNNNHRATTMTNPSFSIYDDAYYNQPDAINDYNPNILKKSDTDYTLNECLHLWEFWKLVIIATLNIVICMFIIALYQDFSLSYLNIRNPIYLAWIGSISSIFHGIFRLFYSYFYDYCVSFQKSNGTTSVILTCFVATLSLAQFGNAKIMLFLWCIVLFSCLGSIYTFIPKCVVKTFGVTNCTEISSIIMLSEIPASIIFGMIATNLSNTTTAYNNILIIMCIFGIISVILTLSFSPENATKQRKKWLKKNNKKKKNNIYDADKYNVDQYNNKYNRNFDPSTYGTNTNNTKYNQSSPKSPIHRRNKTPSSKMRADSITNIIFKYESCFPPYLAVIGGTLIMITIGTTFCFGNLKPYIFDNILICFLVLVGIRIVLLLIYYRFDSWNEKLLFLYIFIYFQRFLLT